MTEIEWNGKGKLTLSTGKRYTIILKREIDLIVYGNGYDFDFAIFAESLKKRILSATKEHTVDIQKCVTKRSFLDILLNFKTDHKIKNLHIFSHAFGAGLSLGYGTERALSSRMALIDEFDNPKRPIPYEEILKSEVGILFVDDLLYEPYLGKREMIRKRFSSQGSHPVSCPTDSIPMKVNMKNFHPRFWFGVILLFMEIICARNNDFYLKKFNKYIVHWKIDSAKSLKDSIRDWNPADSSLIPPLLRLIRGHVSPPRCFKQNAIGEKCREQKRNMNSQQQHLAMEIIVKGADPFWRTRHGESLLAIAGRKKNKELITQYLDSLYVLKFMQYVQQNRLDSANLLSEDIREWNRNYPSGITPLACLLSPDSTEAGRNAEKTNDDSKKPDGALHIQRLKLAIKLIRQGADPCQYIGAKDNNLHSAKSREELVLESLLDSIYLSGKCAPAGN